MNAMRYVEVRSALTVISLLQRERQSNHILKKYLENLPG